MHTLLEIYESFHNGQRKQFVKQVKEYGEADFARDVQVEINDGVLAYPEAFKMLQAVMLAS